MTAPVVGDYVWAYVGGVGYVITDRGSGRFGCMNSSRAGGSYDCSSAELEPFLLYTTAPPTGAPAQGSTVYLKRGSGPGNTRKQYTVLLYLHSVAFDVDLALLLDQDTCDVQATAYASELHPV